MIEARINNGEKIVFSISGAGKTGQLHVKEWNKNTSSHHTKINSKWIRDLNVRPDSIKILEENIDSALFDRNRRKIFKNLSPRVIKIKTKINKSDLIKLKSFCKAKETIN